MDSLLDALVEYGIDKRLNKVLQAEEEFISLERELAETINDFDELDLGKEINLVVDKMVSAYNAEGAFITETAYRLGISDCVELLKELHIL